MSEPVTVRVSRAYGFSAERVYDAFLDPALARQFLFATPDGEIIVAETNPRVGGAFVFTERRDGIDVKHYGEYLELQRPTRLVFSFAVDEHPHTRVEIEIESTGADSCELTLTHQIPAEYAHYAERTEQGWTTILGGLNATLQLRTVKLVCDVCVLTGEGAMTEVLLVRYADTAGYDGQRGWFLPDDLIGEREHPDDTATRILQEQCGISGHSSISHVESFTGGDRSWHLALHYVLRLAGKPEVRTRSGVQVQWFRLDALPTRSEVAHGGWALGTINHIREA